MIPNIRLGVNTPDTHPDLHLNRLISFRLHPGPVRDVGSYDRPLDAVAWCLDTSLPLEPSLSLFDFTGPGKIDPSLNTYTPRTNPPIYPALSVDVQDEEMSVR